MCRFSLCFSRHLLIILLISAIVVNSVLAQTDDPVSVVINLPNQDDCPGVSVYVSIIPAEGSLVILDNVFVVNYLTEAVKVRGATNIIWV